MGMKRQLMRNSRPFSIINFKGSAELLIPFFVYFLKG